jgi:hypothetical protein
MKVKAFERSLSNPSGNACADLRTVSVMVLVNGCRLIP